MTLYSAVDLPPLEGHRQAFYPYAYGLHKPYGMVWRMVPYGLRMAIRRNNIAPAPINIAGGGFRDNPRKTSAISTYHHQYQTYILV